MLELHRDSQRAAKCLKEDLLRSYQQFNTASFNPSHNHARMSVDIQAIYKTQSSSSTKLNQISCSIGGISDILHDLDRHVTRTLDEQLKQSLQLRHDSRKCTDYLQKVTKLTLQQQRQSQQNGYYISLCIVELKMMKERYIIIVSERKGNH